MGGPPAGSGQGLGQTGCLEGYTLTSQFSTPKSNCAWPSGATETPPLLHPSLLFFAFSLLGLLLSVSLCSSVSISPYLSHHSNTPEPRSHTCTPRGLTCGRATGMKKNADIKQEKLGPGATLALVEICLSCTSEGRGGGGGLLRTWKRLATAASRSPACAWLAGLSRRRRLCSALCPWRIAVRSAMALPVLRPHPVRTRRSAPWVTKLGRAGMGRCLIQSICEMSPRGHWGTGRRNPFEGLCRSPWGCASLCEC